MGLYLSKPLRDKHGEVTNDSDIRTGVAEMQGWRLWMEDAHLNVTVPSGGHGRRLHLLGVFDGHGGPAVARWVAMNFEESFSRSLKAATKTAAVQEYLKETQKPISDNISLIAETLYMTFMDLDSVLRDCAARPIDALEARDIIIFEDLNHIQITSHFLREAQLRKYRINTGNARNDLLKSFMHVPVLMGAERRGNGQTDGNDASLSDDPIQPDLVAPDGVPLEKLAVQNQPFQKVYPHVKMLPAVENCTTEPLNLQNAPWNPKMCGCAAVVGALLLDGEDSSFIVANAGDSRALIIRNGEAVSLTKDHKPTQDRENDRIIAAGGSVVSGRIQGNLNLSRTLGDTVYKMTEGIDLADQMITAKPDLTFVRLCREDEFVVLACDGIWDVLTPQGLAVTVMGKWNQLVAENEGSENPKSEGDMCKEISDQLCEECISQSPFENLQSGGIGCDNMTVVVVRLSDELRATLGDRDERNSVVYYGTEDEMEAYNRVI